MASKDTATTGLPPWFDGTKKSHVDKLDALIEKQLGSGWQVDSIDQESKIAYLSRTSEVDTVLASDASVIEVGLATDTKTSDGDKVAARMASMHPGFVMTSFRPLEGRAVLSKLPKESVKSRLAVANALGVKPWDVQISKRRGGGYDVLLPKSYQESKHRAKLDEVAVSTVGKPGWWVEVNPLDRKAVFHPGELPVFESAYKYPFAQAGKDTFTIPIGVALGSSGVPNSPLDMFLGDSSGGIIQGLAGAGKALGVDERIPVPVSERFPSGWARVGDLKHGDRVFGSSGETIELSGFSETLEEEMFDVHVSDGQVIRTSGSHAWKAGDYFSRLSANERVRKGDRKNTWLRQKVQRLEEVAAKTPSGVFSPVSDIAARCGVPRAQVDQVVQNNEIGMASFTKISPHELKMPRKVTRWNAEQAAPVLQKAGIGQLLTKDRITNRWASLKELSFGLGLENSAEVHNRIRWRLSQAGVDHKTEVELTPCASPKKVRQVVQTYPVAEVATLLAEMYQAKILDRPVFHTVTTQQMAESLTVESGQRTNWAIPASIGIDAPAADLLVPPYVLGAWLGDGVSRSGCIVAGSADVDEIRANLESAWGHETPARDNRSLGEMLSELNLKQNKHIPSVYLRSSRDQRLAVLQGLMDADGTIDKSSGGCELTLCSKQLAVDALELVRSLGVKASMTTSPALITEQDPDNPGQNRRRVVGKRYRIHFTTTKPVFKLNRKRSLLPVETRATQDLLYVTDIVPAGKGLVRCLRVEAADSLHLAAGFVVTHNSVAVNALLYGCLAAGHEIAIIDVPHKAQDFEWAKPFVRKHGWGCESRAAAVTVMALVQEEGERRGQLLREYGAGKWQDLPAKVRAKTPILTVIMDEVAGLFASDPIPKNLPKDHEVRIAAEQAAAEVDLLKSKVIKLPAEMRAAGIRLVLATQQAQSNLGIPPSVKLNLPNRILLGAKATKQARGHAFANPDALPWVPEYIADNEKMAKGTGVSEFEGQAAAVFKAYYASTSDYLSHMNKIGLPTTLNPEPPQSLIDKHVPNFFEEDFPDDGRPSSTFDAGGFGETHDDFELKGAAKAAHDGKLERDQAALRARSAH